MRHFINENIENYYVSELRSWDPKFVFIDDILNNFNEPLSRPSLKGLDVVFCGNYFSFKDYLYELLLYATDEGANSICLASITNSDPDMKYLITKYIQDFDECKSNYIKLTKLYKERGTRSDSDEYRFKPFEKIMKINPSLFIPKRFDRLLKSITIHAFNNDGEFLM